MDKLSRFRFEKGLDRFGSGEYESPLQSFEGFESNVEDAVIIFFSGTCQQVIESTPLVS